MATGITVAVNKVCEIIVCYAYMAIREVLICMWSRNNELSGIHVSLTANALAFLYYSF